jgi:hypothetical protein
MKPKDTLDRSDRVAVNLLFAVVPSAEADWLAHASRVTPLTQCAATPDCSGVAVVTFEGERSGSASTTASEASESQQRNGAWRWNCAHTDEGDGAGEST